MVRCAARECVMLRWVGSRTARARLDFFFRVPRMQVKTSYYEYLVLSTSYATRFPRFPKRNRKSKSRDK